MRFSQLVIKHVAGYFVKEEESWSERRKNQKGWHGASSSGENTMSQEIEVSLGRR